MSTATRPRTHITATTRSCAVCRRLIGPDEPGCPDCGLVKCPVIADWPPALFEWIPEIRLRHAVENLRDAAAQTKWEFVLRSAYAGRTHAGGLILPYAATAADCLPLAVRDCEAWVAVGKPRFL